MRTGPDANTWATREYQHTNRRVTQITRHPRFTSCSFQLMLIDEKFEEEVSLPLDNNSAISTLPVSDPASLARAHGKQK